MVGAVQVSGLRGAALGALLFGTVNGAVWWFVMGVVVVVPLGTAYTVLFLMRWLVNTLLLMLLHTSTQVLIVKNFSAAALAGVLTTAIGMTVEMLLMQSL